MDHATRHAERAEGEAKHLRKKGSCIGDSSASFYLPTLSADRQGKKRLSMA